MTPTRLVFMKQKLSHLATFPDTSNSCFQTHALAAEQLIINLEAYKEFLLQVKDWKEKGNWNKLNRIYGMVYPILCLLSSQGARYGQGL
ncbi:hypothetical protein BDP27DRAFT_1328373 [Rhodocollybia butyracea]|uniref:Uncharacterized protein n=1 Tax=Rhodocollybia butyracea TaxID=206335 RepID=A0A9P5PQS3_9AGAR|nr:hypothetical protein BDP27DRAFT_1328373 [Rhodocollybia butyracea]